MTTVRDLINALSRFNQDRVIILAKDPEGNGYSPLAGIDEGLYVPTSTWAGDMYYWDSGDHETMQLYDEILASGGQKALVLGPVN